MVTHESMIYLDADTYAQVTADVPDSARQDPEKVIAPNKPERELYDLETDPHELNNVIDDPAYRDIAARLDAALDTWQRDTGDLGLVTEEDLLAEWRPDGERPALDALQVRLGQNATVEVRCDTPGARVGWTDQPPSAALREDDPFIRMLGLVSDGRPWRPASGPIELDCTMYFKAWRPGYRPSPEVTVAPPD